MSVLFDTTVKALPVATATARPAEITATNGRQQVATGGNSLPRAVESGVKQDDRSASAEDIEAYFNGLPQDLQFQVDDKSGVSIISVLEGATGEVIWQFPAEEIVASARYLAEQMPDELIGKLLDTEV